MTALPLSLVIPTWNFGRFIGATIESLLTGHNLPVEILIIDGASTDDTAEVVAALSDRDPRVRYHRLPVRGGIDNDVAAGVAAARGRYCWLFSADDLVVPGAVAEVFRRIESEADVYLLSHANCTFDMGVIVNKHPVLSGTGALFELRSAKDRAAYFARALSSEAFFSFLSGIVVKRATWDPTRDVARFHHGSCWGHAARLLTVMRDEGLTLEYVDRSLVKRRGDNDSFRSTGIVQRFALAVEGYQTIVNDVFGNGPELAAIRRVLGWEFGVEEFLYGRKECALHPERENVGRLKAMYHTLHSGRPVMRALVWGVPNGVLVLATRVRRALATRKAA